MRGEMSDPASTTLVRPTCPRTVCIISIGIKQKPTYDTILDTLLTGKLVVAEPKRPQHTKGS